MHKKQKISAFDIVAFIVFLALAFVFWSFMRAVSLVQPADFDIDVSQVVSAAAPEPVIESGTKPNLDKNELEAELDEVLARFADTQPNDYGIYVKHLGSGVFAEHNGQLKMTMASLYKPFAAVEVLEMAEAGLLNLAQTALEDGTTLDDCLEKTITVSDNRCGLALLSAANLSSDYGQDKLKALGYKDTDLRGYFPQTTARDMAKLFENIYLGTDMSDASRQRILDTLLRQKINDRISQGLPVSADFAHKTGDLNGYAHDAGLVLDGKSGDYVIVIMSGPDDSGRLLAQRYADFGRLAEDIHQVMVKYSVRLGASSS